MPDSSGQWRASAGVWYIPSASVTVLYRRLLSSDSLSSSYFLWFVWVFDTGSHVTQTGLKCTLL